MIRWVDQRTAFLRKWMDNITEGMKRLKGLHRHVI